MKISFVGILDYYVAFVISSHISLNPVNAVGGYGEEAGAVTGRAPHLFKLQRIFVNSTQVNGDGDQQQGSRV